MQQTEHAPINGTDLSHAPSEDAAERTERLRDRVRAILAATGLTQTALADAIGAPKGTLNSWLRAAYTRPAPRLEAAIDAWLREHDGDGGAEIPFVETPTSERIVTALAHAHANGDMTCVYGAPGVGKTRAIERYASQFDRVWVIEARKSCATLVPCLERVAAAVGVEHLVSGAARLSMAIEGKVRDTHGLIIIDEAQHLGLDALEELRAIHDATKVGLALVGNEIVYARLTGGARVVQYAQLFSRIGCKMYVRQPSRGDVRAITDLWQVQDAKALELLARVATKPGALRTVVKVLKLASIGGSAVTSERVRAAMDHLGTEDA